MKEDLNIKWSGHAIALYEELTKICDTPDQSYETRIRDTMCDTPDQSFMTKIRDTMCDTPDHSYETMSLSVNTFANNEGGQRSILASTAWAKSLGRNRNLKK